jgi:hypothetical protein
MRIAFGAAVNSVHDALMRLTPPAFEKRRNFRNGAVEWQEYRFGDLTLESYEGNSTHGLVLKVSSPDPATTVRGLEKYKARWDDALNEAFGQSVRLTLTAGNERVTPPPERREVPGTGELVPIASIVASFLGPEPRWAGMGDRGSKSLAQSET